VIVALQGCAARLRDCCIALHCMLNSSVTWTARVYIENKTEKSFSNLAASQFCYSILLQGCVIVVLQCCVIVSLHGCVIIGLQCCVIVVLQGCVIVPLEVA
jgi:hypothetical protein